MFARVSTYRADDADKLIEGFGTVTDQLTDVDGFSHAYFLVDRESGKAMSITLWRSEDTLEASARKADELRRTGSERGGGAIETVEHFEVGLTVGDPAAALSR